MITSITLSDIVAGYGVDELGTVYSRLVPAGPGQQALGPTWKPLKPFPNNKGYAQVTLGHDDGTRKKYLVHRLVLLTLVGPCPEGYETRHEDGDRKSNRLDNLSWGTPTENDDDRRRHGTLPRGEDAYNAKLSDADVEAIRQAKGVKTQGQLAKEYGVNQSTISRIQTNKRRGI